MYISLPQAAKQAAEEGRSLDEHLPVRARVRVRADGL